jgi:hypothetical protein
VMEFRKLAYSLVTKGLGGPRFEGKEGEKRCWKIIQEEITGVYTVV